MLDMDSEIKTGCTGNRKNYAVIGYHFHAGGRFFLKFHSAKEDFMVCLSYCTAAFNTT